MFFGTPHAGGKDGLVMVGRAAARIVNFLAYAPENDIMQAVRKGSLYADMLEESWKHQLHDFSITTFYEGKGDVR